MRAAYQWHIWQKEGMPSPGFVAKCQHIARTIQWIDDETVRRAIWGMVGGKS